MINIQELKAAVAAQITPSVLADLGLQRVPIRPDGSTTQELLLAYIQAGRPSGLFFQRHRLVSLDVWSEAKKQTAESYDPITLTPETPTGRAEWNKLAPIQTLSGPVSAADLCSYAKLRDMLPQDFGTYPARALLAKGAEPVEPHEALAQAALWWPYDPKGQVEARRRRTEGPLALGALLPPDPRMQSSNSARSSLEPVQLPGFSHSPPGFTPPVSPDLPENPAALLPGLLLKLYGVDELSRVVHFRYSSVESQIPAPAKVAPASYVSDVVDAIRRVYGIDLAFFQALHADRPLQAHEIARVAWAVVPSQETGRWILTLTLSSATFRPALTLVQEEVRRALGMR